MSVNDPITQEGDEETDQELIRAAIRYAQEISRQQAQARYVLDETLLPMLEELSKREKTARELRYTDVSADDNRMVTFSIPGGHLYVTIRDGQVHVSSDKAVVVRPADEDELYLSVAERRPWPKTS